MKAFEDALAGYLAWRTEAAKLLGQPLPSEIPQLLKEQAALEPMRLQSEDWRAEGEAQYYRRKNAEVERMWAEVAKTALHEVAKPRAYKELWMRTSAEGLNEAVKSRQFTVRAELKRMGA